MSSRKNRITDTVSIICGPKLFYKMLSELLHELQPQGCK